MEFFIFSSLLRFVMAVVYIVPTVLLLSRYYKQTVLQKTDTDRKYLSIKSSHWLIVFFILSIAILLIAFLPMLVGTSQWLIRLNALCIMAQEILNVSQLKVGVEDKEILHGVDLSLNKGETHVLMGPNGAGKSTLGYALMGNPRYEILGGKVTFNGEDLLSKNVAERSQAGLFLSFQNPIEVPGITLGNFIRSSMEQRGKKMTYFKFKKLLQEKMEFLQMDPSYMDRDLNVGFSGGEKKKAEILQLLMLEPSLAILDETDSGLDVDAVKTVSLGVEEYQKTQNGALLIITHSTRILEALKVDYTHVLVNGNVVATGDSAMIDDINENGFERFIK